MPWFCIVVVLYVELKTLYMNLTWCDTDTMLGNNVEKLQLEKFEIYMFVLLKSDLIGVKV